MYLTYMEYQSYGGTLDETTFTDYEFEAESWINWYTFNRLQNETEYSERVKRCVYQLIKLAKLKSDALTLGEQVTGNGEASTSSIASQSNDGVSISYNIIGASDVFRLLQTTETGNVVEDTIRKYLNGEKNSLGRAVLYRGLYPNE